MPFFEPTFVSEATLDFHTFGPLLPYDIEKILTEFIEDSNIAGYKNLLIVTGKGVVVKPHVKKLLTKSKFVDNFKQAGYFTGQSGAFEVSLI